jgi:hypothetical protein
MVQTNMQAPVAQKPVAVAGQPAVPVPEKSGGTKWWVWTLVVLGSLVVGLLAGMFLF